jgi:hypothetical protein
MIAIASKHDLEHEGQAIRARHERAEGGAATMSLCAAQVRQQLINIRHCMITSNRQDGCRGLGGFQTHLDRPP